MTSIRFEVDDIAVSGEGRVILAKGERRIALSRLTDGQVAALVEAARTGSLDAGNGGEAIAAKLRNLDFPFWEPGRRRPSVRLGSRSVTSIAGPLAGLAHPAVLTVFLLAGLINIPFVIILDDRPRLFFDIVFGSLGGIIGLCFGFWICVMAHEAGHAAACLRSTGMVGGLRLKLHWGMPAVATDVSAIAMADARDRKWINLAGPAWHVAAALLVYYAAGPFAPSVAMGAAFAFPIGFAALIPFPGFDGFWILQDAARTKITGPLRRPRRGDMVAPVYCWILLAFFVLSMGAMSLFWVYLLGNGADGVGVPRTVLQAMAAVFVLSALLAIHALRKFLRAPEAGKIA